MSAKLPHATGWPYKVSQALLLATAGGKASALLSNPSSLDIVHPALGAPLGSLVLLGLVAELVVIVSGLVFGRIVFGFSLSVLTFCFGSYHALEGLGFQTPCHCIGGLSRIHPWLSKNEGVLSILLCFTLALLAGMILRSPAKEPKGGQPITAAIVGALVWILCFGLHAITLGGSVWNGDEAMELSKALALRSHPEMFADSWNDQSSLWTWIVSAGWSATYPSPVGVRVTAVLFGSLIPASLAFALSRFKLEWASIFVGPAVALGLGSVEAAVSGMMELPAFAIGCCCAIPLAVSRSITASLLAGAIAGIGIAIKPTAAFGVALSVILSTNSFFPSFVASCLVTASATLYAVGWNPVQMFQSHAYLYQEALKASLSPLFLTQSPIVFIGAIASTFLAARFPSAALRILLYLYIAFIIHGSHVPFWSYYSAHFLVPFGLIIGIGCFSVIGPWTMLLSPVLACVGFLVRFQPPGAFSSVVLAQASKTWNGSVRTVISFAHELPVVIGATPVPEFSLFPKKRFWSGYGSRLSVAQGIEEFRPDLVCLPTGYTSTHAFRFVTKGWHRVGTWSGFEIWTAPHIPRHTFSANSLKSLGL